MVENFSSLFEDLAKLRSRARLSETQPIFDTQLRTTAREVVKLRIKSTEIRKAVMGAGT